MARVVWKFRMHEPQVPSDHKFLHADVLDNRICFWLEVDPNSPMIANPYSEYPTGLVEVPKHGEHMASVINRVNNTVWHIYKH